MDMEDLVSCSICMETFDENIRPRSLPCGHTFCTDCITNAIEGGLHSCAHCKKQHQASNGSDFPITYAFEALALKFRETQLGAIPKCDHKAAAQPGRTGGLSRKMQALIHDQKDQLESLLKVTDATKNDITEYKTFINERKGKHTELRVKIQIMQQHNEEIIFQLEKEDKRVTGFLKEVEDHQKEAKKKLRKVDTLTNASHILAASEEIERVHDDLEAWNEKCKMQLPCTESITRSQKVVKKTTEALDLYKDEEYEAPSDVEELIQTDLSIMEKTKSLMERTKTCEKNVKMGNYKLLSLEGFQSTWRILKSGQSFAVQEIDGVVRYAKITVEKDKIYLHSLLDIAPPAGAFTILYEEVIESLNKDSVVAFMDLAWEGSIKGRIKILLSPETPLATHFWKLCTAELGPSYLHTRFLQKNQVIHYCYGGYTVTGGDYESDDGSGGAPLFKGLQNDSDIYSRELKAGSVGTVDSQRDGKRSAQFQIYTYGLMGISPGIFGQVQDGLDLVRAASKLDDIKKVRIEDCGIVLPY